MKKILLTVAVVSAFVSCRNLPDFDELTYKPIVVTNHAANADFSAYQTYYLSNTLHSIGDDIGDSIMNPSDAAPILNAIANNMNDRGYVRESNPALADLDLNVLAIKVTNVATMYPGTGGDTMAGTIRTTRTTRIRIHTPIRQERWSLICLTLKMCRPRDKGRSALDEILTMGYWVFPGLRLPLPSTP
jgi:hypothetical protein